MYDQLDSTFDRTNPASGASLEAAREVLRRTFGHSDFRGLQAGVIGELLAGRSALAVLPTGGGKSLCYQIPALVRPGLGLVVSPLIALMADQVAGLQQAGVAAERLDSNTLPGERTEIWRRIDAGTLDLLYLSPEGLMQPSMLERLSRLPLSLVAVDEAHCVSQWGHDFRPEYRMLGRLAEVFPNAPRLAVTATADARTRDDIRAELRLQGAAEFVDSFARHELALNAERKKGKGHDRVIELVTERPNRAGVVYAGSRDSTEKLAEKLIAEGIPALAYHAGLDKGVRARRLEEFLEADEAVMVATIAFGMGVDKPDVRFVIHADPPAAIEAYWQEIGRAGRDRQPAEGITLYSSADLAWAVRRIEAQSAPDEVKTVQLRKLRQFYAMLEGVTCRAAAVRRYFGEEGVERCGVCDICVSPPNGIDASQAAQKALSAAHRLGGRFGRGRLVDHLLGKTKDVTPAEAQMSTFGIGKEFSPQGWRDLLDTLVFEGLLREDPNDGRPLIGLGDGEGVRQVYRGERLVSLRQQPTPADSPGRSSGGGGAGKTARKRQALTVPLEDQALFEALRSWRREEAALQHVPPYVIFHDATLAEIAAARPATAGALAKAGGVGQGKLDRYGEAVLKVVRDN
uniref:DNA helicase RecQ n=1 Tax=Caulobacter sp. (strain K31) TaxID=366602 RepID=B0SYG3_CAUSK